MKLACILMVIALILAINPATAQIVYSEADVRSMVNGRVIESYASAEPWSLEHLVDRKGPGQVFDITGSDFEFEYTYSADFVNCAENIPGCSDEFLSASNMVVRFQYSDSTAFVFGSLGPSLFAFRGFAYRTAVDEEDREFLEELGLPADQDSITLALTYDPHLLEMELPLEMGATWSGAADQHLYVLEVGFDLGSLMPISVEVMSEVDGWGQLITPHGSFDALRYSTTTITRTSLFGFEIADTSHSITIVTLDDIQVEISVFEGGVEYVGYRRAVGTTSGETLAELPVSARIRGNYPNPFNPSTTIQFEVDQPGHVRIGVYDLMGREVSVLHEGMMNAGSHETIWDASGFPSGTYIVRLETPAGAKARPIVLLK